ncbi:hypothetical protein CVT24_001913 [Panaeolus cyanescens]|uniref:Glycosyltransferase family 49 protein n=1 Tax=Panaeolus cyanescens TaxID=181874 RepID=A0A409WXW3_9AGAR|nr:hypothetical protein CVT24_001913 [Panaeolus cyanescens]
MALLRLFSSCCKLFVYLFILVAVLDTTNKFVIAPVVDSLLCVLHLRTTIPIVEQETPTFALDHAQALSAEQVIHLSQSDGTVGYPWRSSQNILSLELGHSEPVLVDPNRILSKIFSGSMYPTNIVPYFYRAKRSFNKDDITITTLITSNRLEVFSRLVERYEGPISVTVHIKNKTEHIQEVLANLQELYVSSPKMASAVDVHIVVDAFDRQFNTWRNIARLFARTDFVMMLDIDFYPCTDFSTLLQTNLIDGAIKKKMQDGRAALVVPAFEYLNFREGQNYSAFPSNKTDLLALVKARRIDMFHSSWGPGHNSTNYKKFYTAAPGEIYKVTRYQPAYEPYVIFKKDIPAWCDERFVGYGGNKAACLFEMYLAGVSYYVLSDHFIIHQNHRYEEKIREEERKHNRKVYLNFKEETCLRFLTRYHHYGVLRSSIAENALTECKKIKSFVKLAPSSIQDALSMV